MRTNKPVGNAQGDLSTSLRLQTLSNLVSRAVLSQYLGKSFNGNRDLYAALGYLPDSELSYNHYYARYARQDIAQRLIDAPVSASWRGIPSVVDGDGEEKEGRELTAFEKGWKALVRNRRLNLFNAFQSADRFAGLGRFSIIVLGYKGDTKLEEPVTAKEKRELAYIRAYGEGSISLGPVETNMASPRYGMPRNYTIKNVNDSGVIINEKGGSNEKDNSKVLQNNIRSNTTIHYSRVIHIIDGLTESPVFGVPRLKAVFNRLMDLEKVAGGSAEMYWRGARPGMQFDLDPESVMTDESKNLLKSQMDEYENNLRRVLRTQGVDINQLAPQVEDPSQFIDTQISLISGAMSIPKRILMGSERGELASTQDAHNWNTTVGERRTDFCEPSVLCPFIETCIETGLLPKPDAGYYTIEWPDLFAPSDKEQAEVSKMRSEALMMYSNSLNGIMIIPPEAFIEQIMGFSGSKLKKVLDAMKDNENQMLLDEKALNDALNTPDDEGEEQ